MLSMPPVYFAVGARINKPEYARNGSACRLGRAPSSTLYALLTSTRVRNFTSLSSAS
ncbi:hypothetical protein D3C85_1683320 [compost metagenome]